MYARAGEYDKAEAPLLRALSMAGNTAVRATVLLHIAEMLMGQGKMESAKEMIDSAEQFMGGQTVKIPEQNEILAETKKLYEEKTKK